MVGAFAVIQRYLRSQVIPFPYLVEKTKAFRIQEATIQDPTVKAKLGELIGCLQVGDKRLNDSSLNKHDRFITKNNDGFFDSSGKFIADFMADGMHIRHFHIGYNKPTNDQLVYALFNANQITLLAIGRHSDMYIESKNNPIFSVLESELPTVAEAFCPVMKGVSASHENAPLSTRRQ